MDVGTKILITHVRANPWDAIYWKACRTEIVAKELRQLIDDAIFEHRPDEAIELAHIFLGLSVGMATASVRCRAEACLGSAFRLLGRLDLAIEHMQRAEKLAGSAAAHLGEVYWRWGAVAFYQPDFEQALSFFDRAVKYLGEAGEPDEVCNALLCRSGARACLQLIEEGFADVSRAIELIEPYMPGRYFITAAINVLALAVCSESREKVTAALEMVERLKAHTKGVHAHAKVRPMLRWIRGLGYEKQGDVKESVRALESAIRGLDRFEMLNEKKAAMADLARIRRKGKQLETNDRHIRRLIEECLRLEENPETVEVLERARREPSEQNLFAWRSRLPSRVPAMEPVATAGVIA